MRPRKTQVWVLGRDRERLKKRKEPTKDEFDGYNRGVFSQWTPTAEQPSTCKARYMPADEWGVLCLSINTNKYASHGRLIWMRPDLNRCNRLRKLYIFYPWWTEEPGPPTAFGFNPS